MLQDYTPILLHFVVVAGLAGAMLGLSSLIGPKLKNKSKVASKLAPYECGIAPVGTAQEPFTVKFYLVAMLFILFDVEVIFFFPWAIVFRELGSFGFIEMITYVGILLAGYIYVWKKGALNWNR